MAENLYKLLLKLYPGHFRRAYGDEALRLVLDRARDEKGFLRAIRLWLDLLADLAISLPREYSKAPAARTLAANPVNGAPSFQLLTNRSLSPALLFVAGLLTAASFWICVTVVAHSRTVASRHPADSSSLGAYRFCMTARGGIPHNSSQPLLCFDSAPPGTSWAALVNGKIVGTFEVHR